jgi:spore coat-associated protein N
MSMDRLTPCDRLAISVALILVAVAVVVAVALAGAGAFATFTSSASVSQSITSGTVTIAPGAIGMANNRLSVDATGLVPGDTIQRAVNLSSSPSTPVT